MFASNRVRGLANGIGIVVSGSRSPARAEPFSLGRGPHMSRSYLRRDTFDDQPRRTFSDA
jgi:hypothetical protein